MIIVGVIIIALILVASVAVIMMSNNDDGSNGNNNSNNNGNGDGTNGDTNGDGDNGNGGTSDGDGDGDGGSQLTGGWIDIRDKIGTHQYLTGGYAINDKVWLIAGFYMLISEDDGNSFTNISLGTHYASCIFMRSETEGYIGTSMGRILRTTDGGSTWNVLGGTLLNSINSISFPPTGDIGYCCGNNAWVGTVNSSGITSTQQLAVSDFYSITFPVENEGWLCGGAGIFFHYTGGSWNSVSLASGSLSSVYFAPNTTEGWVVGDGGLLAPCSDGISFGYQTNPDPLLLTLNDVFSLDGQHAWIVGDGGRILHTTNGGSEWVMEAEGMTTESFQAVFFTSPTNGYAVGTNGTLLKYVGE